MSETAPLLALHDVRKLYPSRGGWFGRHNPTRAVDGVSLDIYPGETLGLVGESGSGKSTLAQLIMRMVPPSGGKILFQGRDVTQLHRTAARDFTAQCQMVFQDPYSSLNPRRTVRQSLSRPFIAHGLALGAREIERRVMELLAEVGLEPQRYADRYPHQMSGGERQRVAIARAIALRPKLIVADEPVSSLDVSVCAQLLNLFKDLQQRHTIAFLFITHDVATLRSVSQRVAVMYRGRIVELGETADVIETPAHPYTQALISAVPIPDPRESRARPVIALKGGTPSRSGCPFHPRCPVALPACAEQDAPWRQTGARWVRCILNG